MHAYDKLVEALPTDGVPLLFRAVITQQLGRVAEAVELADRAMSLIQRPNETVLINFGVILKNAGLIDRARVAYQSALSVNPASLAAKSNLGTLELAAGNVSVAKLIFEELVEKLEEAAPLLNLARIALREKNFEKASQYLDRAEDISPKDSDLLFLRAKLYMHNHDLASAFTSLIHCLGIKPSHREAWNTLKSLPAEIFELEAIEGVIGKLIDQNVQLVSPICEALSIARRNLLWNQLDQLELQAQRALDHPLNQRMSVSFGFTLLGANVTQRHHLNAAKSIWSSISSGVKPLSPPAALQLIDDKPLKVAFLSSDLRNHAVAYNLVGFFEALTHENITWFVFSNSLGEDSPHRARIRKSMDRFINIAELTDEEAAQRIRRDEIDVLIDLNNLTKDTRVRILAYRPAPIQLTAVGMPGSLGTSSEVDYLMTHEFAVDALNRNGFSEQLVVGDFFAHDPVSPDFTKAANRKEHNLPEAALVLCNFNQHFKYSPETLELWSEILRNVEDTVLWIVQPPPESKTRLLAYLLERGVTENRVVFAKHVPWEQHVARIKHADLVLDTLPYGAHTTCADALRAGVPVLTLVGETWAGRIGRYYLSRCGLEDWITFEARAYVTKAIAYASLSRSEIDEEKRRTFEAYWRSDLTDCKGAADRFERMCKELVRRKVNGEPNRDLQLIDGQFFEIDLHGKGAEREDGLSKASVHE
jgi:predicted O-linked N-acetylglucosamine transferase (SPINDLY family)